MYLETVDEPTYWMTTVEVRWLDFYFPEYSIQSDQDPILASSDENVFEVILQNYVPSNENLTIEWKFSDNVNDD